MLATVLAAIALACKSDASSITEEDQFLLEGISLEQLQEKMTSGELTSVAITGLYIDRIRKIDQSGPNLRAVLEINPDAMAIAAELDLERAQGKVRGPLHGVPIMIKDNIDTGDRMQTTAGSLAMLGNRAKNDAHVIKLLRDAGAIILGKTNLSEWSNYRSLNSVSGWSSRGGQTKNPYVLTMSPCGSSTGSAVATSADLCMVAVGTSTNGSIACPSSYNGVVGIRPTTGLVSRSGIIPISKTQDTPGPIGRTVWDATVLFGAMIGQDKSDDATNLDVEFFIKDYTPYLEKNGLFGKRIGIEKAMLQEKEGIGALLQEAILQMQRAGAVIVEIEVVAKYDELIKAEQTLLKYEFKDGINRYLNQSQGEIQSLSQLIEYNLSHSEEVMSYFGQDLLENANNAGNLQSPEYIAAKKTLAEMNQYLEDLVRTHSLDIIAGVGYGAYSPPAVAGWPSITLPMGYLNEVPVGITFFARPFAEHTMLSVAYAYEQISQHRKTPKFLPAMKSS